MLVVRKCPDSARHGEAFVASGVKRGCFVKLDGVFTQADIDALPEGQKNKPGYAYVGAPKLNVAFKGVTGRVFPVDYYVAAPEDSESDWDTIPAGHQAVYYTEGEFETDQYSGVSGTGANFGDYLKLNTKGQLTEEANPATETSESVARVVKWIKGGTFDKDRLRFVLIT